MTKYGKSGQNLITGLHHCMVPKHRRSCMKTGVTVARKNPSAVVAGMRRVCEPV